MTVSTRSRSTTVSSNSLMQDVPGAFPVRHSHEAHPNNHDNDLDESDEPAAPLNLFQAVQARRAEYLRPKHLRIKIGTWNVAAHKGTEKDVAGWFVEGKGVAEALTGLKVSEDGEATFSNGNADSTGKEDISAQEARYKRKAETIPKNDSSVLPGNEEIGLYVLGLQEVVDINSTTEALRPYSDPAVSKKWQEELEKALPPGYRLVAEQQLIGLLLLIYAAPELADDVKSVSTTSVGTGLMGYMGNKGAVTARLVIGDTTRLVFVNCHLASGAEKTALERRNWDALQILQRTRFEPIKDAMDLSQSTGEQIGDEDFAFWSGDLNYRLQTIPGDDVRRLLMLHTRNEYDTQRHSTDKIDREISIATQAAMRRREQGSSSGDSKTANVEVSSPRPSLDESISESKGPAPPSLDDVLDPNDDPISLQTTLSSLLPHDELHQQMQHRRAFQDGWREGPISFLPTYKYDVGSVGVFDSSEKKRAPSWCDRILYRTRRDKLAYDAKIKEEREIRRRDEEMKANGTADQAADDDDILYDYDPDADGTNYNDELDEYDENDASNEQRDAGASQGSVVVTREGAEDELRLEYYTAHQRVLSSDHKPLNAVFLLKYDAVVPELKAKVHAEVAKELDKAENEGRPNVTVVVDQQTHSPAAQRRCDDSGMGFEGVDFGDVRWNQACARALTIANTSRVPASLTFIERPVENGTSSIHGVAPAWLSVKVNNVSLHSANAASETPITLDPGETAAVELELLVDDVHLVRELNEGRSKLDDTLVLRVEGGRDHFIPIRANWLDSSLGRTIDKLIRIPEGGIRRLQSQRPDGGKKLGPSAGGNSSSGDSGEDGSADVEPVRFSAPRELFRLTEAIEELGARVVAEWDMIADDAAAAPWLLYPGWPFERECWSAKASTATSTDSSAVGIITPGSEVWRQGLSEACDALDTDRPLLSTTLSPAIPRMQQLYILSNMLLVFLAAIPEGVINDPLWDQIDAYLAQQEKSKLLPHHHHHHQSSDMTSAKAIEDDHRTAIQEILSQSPSHSISFILIITLLERLLQEIAGTTHGVDAVVTVNSPTSPGKAAAALRKVTGTFGKGSSNPTSSAGSASYREQATSALARIFAQVLFKRGSPGEAGLATAGGSSALNIKKSTATAQEKRKVELVELFMRRDAAG